MKKFGIIVFICAMTVGILLSYVLSPANFRLGLFSFGKGVVGSGVVKTQKIHATDFTAVDVGGSFKVVITTQKDFDVEVEADENLLPFIRIFVDGDILKIETERSVSSKNPLIVRVSAPGIESVETSGGSEVAIANLDNERLSVEASGASRVKVDGTSKELNADLSGASRIDASGLIAEDVVVTASGASRADVIASGILKAEASGASKVYYSGSPKDIIKDISGASCVREK